MKSSNVNDMNASRDTRKFQLKTTSTRGDRSIGIAIVSDNNVRTSHKFITRKTNRFVQVKPGQIESTSNIHR